LIQYQSLGEKYLRDDSSLNTFVYRQFQNATHDMSKTPNDIETPNKTKTRTKSPVRNLTNQEFNKMLC